MVDIWAASRATNWVLKVDLFKNSYLNQTKVETYK